MEDRIFEYSIRVLLIGKSRETNELLADTLKAIGYDTSIVEIVAEAENALNDSRIDLVIGDPRYLDRSWFEFLESMKKRKPDIPVIFIKDSDPQRKKYINRGADGIIEKPFRIGQIEELITAILLNYDKSSIIPDKRSKRILIADDDEAILSILDNSLKVLGYNTTLSRSGKEALDKFIKADFDLLITDYMMPEMTGKELIASIKRIKSDIPAIMITGYPLAYPPEAARSEGIDAYLVKPFRINQLKEIISKLLPAGS